jgi:hypothetical protein
MSATIRDHATIRLGIEMFMKHGRALAITAALAALSGCDRDTGVMLAVSRDPDSTPEAIERLQLFVGFVEEGAPSSAIVGDPSNTEEIALGDRDLALQPYKALLRRGEAMPSDRIAVYAIGWVGEEIAGVGTTDGDVRFVDGAVVEWPILLRGDVEGVGVGDTGCFHWADGSTDGVVVVSPTDQDCDGDTVDTDCDDSDGEVHHGAQEVCLNETDDDCDEEVDEEVDDDGDGVTNCTDCNDTEPLSFPGNPEVCDGKDNDCLNGCDDGEDHDSDGYTPCGTTLPDEDWCYEPDPTLEDCLDDGPGAAAIHPDATELCDGDDNDCDGICDDDGDGVIDPDGDGYTSCGSIVDSCGTDPANIDCEPEQPEVNPASPAELCNGYDDDCDGVRYPERVGCYTTGISPASCLLGFRDCNDADPNGGGFGECSPIDDPGQAGVPAAFCDAFEACEQAGAPDPFACANDQVVPNADSIDCTLATFNGLACFDASVQLPGPPGGGGACGWRILGGGELDHYRVGLRAFDDDEPQDAVDTCPADFVIIEQLGNDPAQPDSVLLWQHSGFETLRLLRLVIDPAALGCGGESLTCDGL